jgi:uncharacterized protein
MARMQFDSAKDDVNIAKHGISLARAEDMKVLAIIEDDRFDYGEFRFRAFGLIDGHPHCLVFVERDQSLRAISLRRAHAKEMQRYAKI